MLLLRTFVTAFIASALVPNLQAQPAGAKQHLQKAHQYLQARQTTLARDEFEAAAGADPGSLDAQANLGVLLYFAGDYSKAAPHLKAALQMDPTQKKLQALLGFSERRLGDSVAAITDLKAALPDIGDPKISKQAGLELVEMQSASNDLAGAAATITTLRAVLPTDPEVLYAAYRTYTDLAGESLLDLSLSGPASAQMHQAIAHELVKARDTGAALINLRQALASDPHLPGAHFELAELLAASSAPDLKSEAATQYEAALVDNPRDDKAFTRLGDLAAADAQHEAAIVSYKRALMLQPANADASIGLAHELVASGEPEAALPMLLEVIREDPTNVLAHFRLSALYRRLHRPEDAKREVADYERLKARRDKLREVYNALRLNTLPTDDPKQ